LELLVREALLQFEQCDADFGNCLIAKCAHSAGCKSIVTLDRKAASSLGVQLLR
jgi:predicted nucleic-acid-binding protein